ncbi:hypothetical protein DPMN_159690 [Dreissena polymorpha]|uniref:Uncharacterized protein n=1 Tax=Dreissena polymorpha TaxID=45954 RepID=A0A9D4EPN3_DREPO|nr:hypothetical protein DPMN_159690 [Dreissena polymorpha]
MSEEAKHYIVYSAGSYELLMSASRCCVLWSLPEDVQRTKSSRKPVQRSRVTTFVKIYCKVYAKALNVTNLQSDFMRTGIYPVDRNGLPKTSLIPAQDFESLESEPPDVGICSQSTESTVKGGVIVEDKLDFFDHIEPNLKSVKQTNSSEKRTRNTLSRHVSGKELISDYVMKGVQEHQMSQIKPKPKKLNARSKKAAQMYKKYCMTSVLNRNPVAGPSCANLVQSSTESEASDDETDPSQLCCVYRKFQPSELAVCFPNIHKMGTV